MKDRFAERSRSQDIADDRIWN